MKNLVKHSTEFPMVTTSSPCGADIQKAAATPRPNKTFEDTRSGKGASVYLSVLFLLVVLHR